MLVACLTSHQHASVSQGRICSDSCTCIHTEVEVAGQICYLTHSQYTGTRPTSPSTDLLTPDAWQVSHLTTNFEVTGMSRPVGAGGGGGGEGDTGKAGIETVSGALEADPLPQGQRKVAWWEKKSVLGVLHAVWSINTTHIYVKQRVSLTFILNCDRILNCVKHLMSFTCILTCAKRRMTFSFMLVGRVSVHCNWGRQKD